MLVHLGSVSFTLYKMYLKNKSSNWILNTCFLTLAPMFPTEADVQPTG